MTPLAQHVHLLRRVSSIQTCLRRWSTIPLSHLGCRRARCESVAHAFFLFLSWARDPARHERPQRRLELRAKETEVTDAMRADIARRDALIFDGCAAVQAVQ